MRGIITADWHLREDKPRCRTDEDWFLTQINALNFIFNQAEERECNIYCVGDIFNKPTVSMKILNMLLSVISRHDVVLNFIPGNHDLPYHNFDNYLRSSFGALVELSESHPKINLIGNSFEVSAEEAFFTHQYIARDSKQVLPGHDLLGEEMLGETMHDWVFSGDNHHNFVIKKNKKTLVNPGCIIRQAADMIDYIPVIYYVDTKRNEIEEIIVPDNAEMVTDEYIKESNNRNDRIESFVQSIKKSGSFSLSFDDNLDRVFSNSNHPEEMVKIYEEIKMEVSNEHKRI